MAYSSDHPLYHLDPQANWHHQEQEEILLQAHHEETRCSSPPSSTCDEHVSGGGGGKPPMAGSTKPNSMVDGSRKAQLPVPEVGLKCPRSESTNTKFCYFNNYSLCQPRHFCKTCHRYWTRGGSLKNVPLVGGPTSRYWTRGGTLKNSPLVGGATSRDSLKKSAVDHGGSPIDDDVSAGAIGDDDALMDDGVPAGAGPKIEQVD